MSTWNRWLSFESLFGGRSRTTAPKTAPRLRPRLEVLEDRVVLSGTAVAYDLTTRGSEQTVEGAIFRQTDAQPTGTGVINSFVRLQGGNASPIEQGYNTDARPLQFDENKSPQFTRSLHLSDVPQVTINGKVYLEFLLDINQSSSQPLLSLDQLQVYVADAPDLTGYDPVAKTLAGNSPLYDLDAHGDNYLKMNYSLNHGSGSGDVLVYVPFPTSVRSGDPYIYLFSRFGENNGANAGFEEWATRSGHSSSLSGYVYLDSNNNGVFEPSLNEVGIGNVLITLTGTDKLGRSVNIQVTTDENGFYSFSNLDAGTYHLAETQPTNYLDGKDTIGTQGGTTGNDYFDITLTSGIIGLFNNFGELNIPPPPPPS